MPRTRRPLVLALAVATAAALATGGCTGGGRPPGAAPDATPPTATSGTTAPSSTSATPAPTTPAATAWGPTAAELATARTDVNALSVRELAGQLVVARYSGRSTGAAARLVARLHLGGVIAFDDNIPAGGPGARVKGLRASAAQVQQVLRSEGRDWPAVVSVDQEGGPVARVGPPATAFTAAMALGAARDPALPRQVGAASGQELRALGFTLVFAPDADVTSGPDDPTIGVRSPGSDPTTVARVASGLVQGYRDAGIVPVAKHFPGHGSVPADSHKTLPVQHASLATLRSRDLVPFRALVSVGAPAVMVAHIDVRAVDPRVPASLSPKVVTGLLRDGLGFEGLAVTDALDMGAVVQGYGDRKAAVRAVQAGADVLLMPPDPKAAVDALVDAVGDGTLTRSRLQSSAARMVALLRHYARVPVPAAGVVGNHASVARAVAAASVTVVSGPCTGPLVGRSVQVVGGTSADRQRFTTAARAAGLHTGSGDVVRLLGTGASSGSGDVVVALDTPYGLARSSARTAALAVYGRTPAVFAALAAVLTGRHTAPGRLPVKVGRHAIGAGCGG